MSILELLNFDQAEKSLFAHRRANQEGFENGVESMCHVPPSNDAHPGDRVVRPFFRDPVVPNLRRHDGIQTGSLRFLRQRAEKDLGDVEPFFEDFGSEDHE